MKKLYLLAVLILCLTPLAGSAQVTDATLKLSVSDAQSNSVAGSSVEIINEETGARRVAVTDNNGGATIAGVPPGN